MGGPPRFGMVFEDFWEDPEGLTLSEREALFVLYLVSCRHNNSLGMFHLSPYYALGDFGRRYKDFSIEEIESLILSVSQKFPTVQYDPKAEVVLIRTYLHHNPITNLDHASYAVKIIEGLSRTPLFQILQNAVEGNPDWFKNTETGKKIRELILDAIKKRCKEIDTPVDTPVDTRRRNLKGDAEADAEETADAKAEEKEKTTAVGSAVSGEPLTEPPSKPDTKTRLVKGEDNGAEEDEADWLPEEEGDEYQAWQNCMKKHGVKTPKPAKPPTEPETVREEVAS